MRIFKQSSLLGMLAGILSLPLSTPLNALEFGSMGNTSAAMGGAGVALKHSAWGLYYNPALLASDPKVKLGYSLGIGLKEHNLSKLTTIDVANMQDTAERLVGMFSGSGGGTGGVSGSAIKDVMDTALDSVLGTGQGQGTNTQQKLESYLQKHPDGNYSDLASAVLSAVQGSNALTQEQKDLLGALSGSIDFGNMDFSSNASGAIKDALQNITINKGGDSGLDKSVEDIGKVQEILKNNNLNVTSQNGVILQISSKTMNEKLGSLGVAYFGSAYSSMSIKADSSRMRLIIQGGGGYYELQDNGNSFSLKLSDKDSYEKYSLIASLEGNSDAHKLIATTFFLSEIPIGYARTFYLKHGNLNLGMTGKLMNALSMQNQINLNVNTDFQKELTNFASLDGAISSNNFGVDLGALYELDLPDFRYLTVGLVAKNINSPAFASTLDKIVIKPQYRLGIGYNSRFFNAAFDADLAPNDLLAFSNIKQQSQMIGGGISFDFRYIDVRAGAMKDLRQDTGLILTGGVNVLGFLDIALQASTKTMEDTSIPQYLNLRVGGSFSF